MNPESFSNLSLLKMEEFSILQLSDLYFKSE